MISNQSIFLIKIDKNEPIKYPGAFTISKITPKRPEKNQLIGKRKFLSIPWVKGKKRPL